MASLLPSKWFAVIIAAAGAASLAQAQTPTYDSGYRSTQTFRSFQNAGGDEEARPTVMGRLEWLKARYGASLPADFSRRMAQEWANQRSAYPQLAPGAAPPRRTSSDPSARTLPT